MKPISYSSKGVVRGVGSVVLEVIEDSEVKKLHLATLRVQLALLRSIL